MRFLKSWIRWLLRVAGYEVRRSDCFGQDALRDVQTIFGGSPVETVFDVGANTGQSAEEFVTRLRPRAIHCFEPSEEAFGKLREISKTWPQIKASRLALGETAGVKTLHINSASVTNSLLPPASGSDVFQPQGSVVPLKTEETAVSTVDDYCNSERIDFIDLLKIDTQGYDLRVIQGASRMLGQMRVAAVLVEIIFVPLYAGQPSFEEIYAALSQQGFKLVSLYQVNFTEDGYASWGDALFLQPAALKTRRRCDTERVSLVENSRVIARTRIRMSTPRPAAPPASTRTQWQWVLQRRDSRH